VTKILREQLDQATSANQSLSSEVAKLRAESNEFETREADFRREEQVTAQWLTTTTTTTTINSSSISGSNSSSSSSQ